jgi:VWFA-related protein
MKVVVGLCAVLLLTSSAFAAATAPYIESFEVRVNNVDVSVTDAHGKRVTGLGQEDFEVFENGVRQQITNFSEYRAEAGVDVAASAPASVSRKFVFVIDDMSLHPQVREELKKSIDDLVALAMRNGDEAMVVQPSSITRITLPFTADRSLLLAKMRQAVDENVFRATTPINRERHYFELQRTQSAPVSDAVDSRSMGHAEATIAYLQSIVSAMAEVPGKKTMVLVTESLPMIAGFNGFVSPDVRLNLQWSQRRYDLRPEINALARTASSNGISIYTLQPASAALALAIGGPDVQNRTTTGIDYQRFISNTEATVSVLADRTGGTWSHDTAALFDHLRDDLTTYYSIGYKPTAAAADRLRRIEVRIKGRRDLTVRTRRDVVQKSLTAEMNERVVGHLVYPKDVDELGVTASAGTPRVEHGERLIPVTIEVPIANLTLLPEGDKYRGSFHVHYAAAGRAEFSGGVEREQVVEIPASKIADARTHSWTYTSDLRVLPGQIEIAVGVLDPISRLTTFKTLSVDAR